MTEQHTQFCKAIFSFGSLKNWDVMCSIIPDLSANFNVPQNPDYHPEGPVHVHICKVIDNAAQYTYGLKNPNYIYMLAAVFHDIGKVQCHKETPKEDGTMKYSHIGHELASCDIMKKYRDFVEGFDVDYETLHNIVKDHMRAHLYKSGKMSKPSKREAFEKMPHFEVLMRFAEFDSMGKTV